MLLLGIAWLLKRARVPAAFGSDNEQAVLITPPPKEVREYAQGEGYDIVEIAPGPPTGPTLAIALAPILLVVVANDLLAEIVIPAMDASYLARSEFGETTLSPSARSTTARVRRCCLSSTRRRR